MTCPGCGGSGFVNEMECPACDGSGREWQYDAETGPSRIWCRVCGAQGVMKDPCAQCGGSGVVQDEPDPALEERLVAAGDTGSVPDELEVGDGASGGHPFLSMLAHLNTAALPEQGSLSPVEPVDPSHARGYAGEQEMGFNLFRLEDGWAVIAGPSGAGGHQTTQSGVDGLAYNTRTRELVIIDNKSYARAGTVQSATAIDPDANLLRNLDRLTTTVRARNDTELPMRADVLSRLEATRDAVQAARAAKTGVQLPPGVRLVVSAFGGRSTGISARLRAAGVEFIGQSASALRPPGVSTPWTPTAPRTSTPPFAPTYSARAQTAATAAAMGIQLLSQGAAILATDSAVNRRVREAWPRVEAIRESRPNDLILVRVRGVDVPLAEGTQATTVTGAYVYSGSTQETATRQAESPQLFQGGPTEGWGGQPVRSWTRDFWILPGEDIAEIRSDFE